VTPSQWLARRLPQLPSALGERVGRLAVAADARPGDAVADALLHAAAGALVHNLEATDTARVMALDLLAIDAVTTWAVEAAAESPATFDAWCRGAMGHLSSIADRP
jgi:hypothetical protein